MNIGPVRTEDAPKPVTQDQTNKHSSNVAGVTAGLGEGAGSSVPETKEGCGQMGVATDVTSSLSSMEKLEMAAVKNTQELER